MTMNETENETEAETLCYLVLVCGETIWGERARSQASLR